MSAAASLRRSGHWSNDQALEAWPPPTAFGSQRHLPDGRNLKRTATYERLRPLAPHPRPTSHVRTGGTNGTNPPPAPCACTRKAPLRVS